jgi:hypothetical protein
MTELGILLALGCAAASNIAFLCKHRGACAAPAVELRHPLRSGVALFRSRWWAIGMAIATGAWLLHVAAMTIAPLSLVQAVIAGGLVLLSYPAERWFGHSLGQREWIGLGLAALGLAFLAITVPTGGGDHANYSAPAMIAFESGAVALGVALFASGHTGSPRHHGALLGAAAGVLIGVTNIAIKGLTATVPGDPLAIISPWTGVAVVAAIGSFYAMARALQIGEAISMIALTSVAANGAAILGGVIVFGDPIGGDLMEGLARGGAFVAVIAAVALMPGPIRSAGARA